MRLSNRTVLAALAFVLMGSTPAHAQKKLLAALDVATSKGELVVLSTSVDRTNQTLTIQGQSFGSQAPQVWCETYSMTVLSATDNQLVVFLPAGVPDGTHLLTVVRGPSEKDRASFDMNVGTPGKGPAGPKGDSGAAGVAGAAGAAGPKGDTGPAGPKGDTGAVGPKGDTGAVGAKGDTGAAGPKGDNGLPGSMGPAGSAGPAGPAGPAGAAGEAGAPGAKGDTGSVGPQGAQGPSGAQGAQGATGPQGVSGPAGPSGPQGPVGPQGPSGIITGHQLVSTGMMSTTVPGNGTATLTATCPAGKRVLGGGYETSQVAFVVHPVAMFPTSVTVWSVTLRLAQDTSATFGFRVYAVCGSAIN